VTNKAKAKDIKTKLHQVADYLDEMLSFPVTGRKGELEKVGSCLAMFDSAKLAALGWRTKTVEEMVESYNKAFTRLDEQPRVSYIVRL